MGKFEIGETVQLKSGGPIMTVKGYGAAQADVQVICQWFKNESLKEGEFPEESLEKAKPITGNLNEEIDKRIAEGRKRAAERTD